MRSEEVVKKDSDSMSDDFERQAKVNLCLHRAMPSSDDVYEHLEEFAIRSEAGRLRAEALLREWMEYDDSEFNHDKNYGLMKETAELLSPKEGK
jgi:hypothetical protein